jgi:hypothetical protein
MNLFKKLTWLFAACLTSCLSVNQYNPETKNIEGAWFSGNPDNTKNFSNGYYKVIYQGQHRVLAVNKGILQSVHGGFVSFDGQVMVEKPRFQKEGNNFVGKTFKFNVKPDGSSFIQTGIKGSGSFENLRQKWVKVGNANHNIEGVWMKKLNNDRIMIKMIVDNFWNWIVVDPKTSNVTSALGGSYDYDGEKYIETSHFKFGDASEWKLGRKWQVTAELQNGNLLFHGKNNAGNNFTESWTKYDAASIHSASR